MCRMVFLSSVRVLREPHSVFAYPIKLNQHVSRLNLTRHGSTQPNSFYFRPRGKHSGIRHIYENAEKTSSLHVGCPESGMFPECRHTLHIPGTQARLKPEIGCCRHLNVFFFLSGTCCTRVTAFCFYKTPYCSARVVFLRCFICKMRIFETMGVYWINHVFLILHIFQYLVLSLYATKRVLLCNIAFYDMDRKDRLSCKQRRIPQYRYHI